MSFFMSLMIGANALTSCAPPAGGPWYGRVPVGYQYAAICYAPKRRARIATIA